MAWGEGGRAGGSLKSMSGNIVLVSYRYINSCIHISVCGTRVHVILPRGKANLRLVQHSRWTKRLDD